MKWKVFYSDLVMLNFIVSGADKVLSEWKGNSIKTLLKLASWEHSSFEVFGMTCELKSPYDLMPFVGRTFM